MKQIVLVLTFSLLVSCSSAPLDVHYYNLHNAHKPKMQTDKSKLATVLVKPIQIADYLKPASLVMQVNQHELYYSRKDVWAEDVSSAFYKALVQDLNADSKLNFTGLHTVTNQQVDAELLIELNHFHSTDTSQVVVSGVYSIFDKKNQHNIINKPFYFELLLDKDGFAHSVSKLRRLVSLTAQQIKTDISAL